MRKILLAVITAILLIFGFFTIKQGINNFKIYGCQQIDETDQETVESIDKLNSTIQQRYPAAKKTLDSALSTMEKTKKEYEEKAVLLGNSKYYIQTEEYKIEFLWTKLGNYARANEVEIKIDVTSAQMSGRYNLSFTVSGNYTDVTQFIYDIENDSKLGFKIEDFKMTGGGQLTHTEQVETVDEQGNKVTEEVTVSRSTVTGTFTCKDIKIDLKSVEATSLTVNGKEEKGTEDAKVSTESSDENTVEE